MMDIRSLSRVAATRATCDFLIALAELHDEFLEMPGECCIQP